MNKKKELNKVEKLKKHFLKQKIVKNYVKRTECWKNVPDIEVKKRRELDKKLIIGRNKYYKENKINKNADNDSSNLSDKEIRIMVIENKLNYPICPQCRKNSSTHPNIKFQVCSKCKIVSYCSRKCQKIHFKIHKNHCCKLDSNRLEYPTQLAYCEITKKFYT